MFVSNQFCWFCILQNKVVGLPTSNINTMFMYLKMDSTTCFNRLYLNLKAISNRLYYTLLFILGPFNVYHIFISRPPRVFLIPNYRVDLKKMDTFIANYYTNQAIFFDEDCKLSHSSAMYVRSRIYIFNCFGINLDFTWDLFSYLWSNAMAIQALPHKVIFDFHKWRDWNTIVVNVFVCITSLCDCLIRNCWVHQLVFEKLIANL